MKTSKRNRLLGLALTGSFGLLSATNVLAAAGDAILNKATLSYDVGGTTQAVIESSEAGNTTPGVGNGADTSFLEDRLINFDVVRGGATGIAVPGGTLQAVQFTLTNNGNGDQGFLLKGLNNADGTVDPFASGNNDVFDATSVQTFVENGANAGFQPLEDTAAFVATLAAGAPVDVYVVSTIPLVQTNAPAISLVNNDVAVMTLVAQVAIPGSTGIAADAIVIDDNNHASPGGNGFTNGAENVAAGIAVPAIADAPNNEEVVFGEGTGTQDGTGAADIDSNAQHSDDSSYTIQSAALTVAKTTSTLYDDINLNVLPKAIPGATVRNTITITNAVGAAAATLTNISDVLTLTLMDPVLSNGGAGNAVFPGSAGNNVRIVDGAGTETFCLADNADANGDGCTYNGALGDTVTIDLGAAAGTATLNATESLTVEFNVIVQ
jgi:hypothetical protein